MVRFWIAICVVCGAVLLAAALLVPAHPSAVEARALDKAGARTPGLIEEGITLVQMEKAGPARQLLLAAQAERLPGVDRLASAVNQFNREHRDLAPWGGADPTLENTQLGLVKDNEAHPVVDLLMQRAVREKMLSFLFARAEGRDGRSGRQGLNHFLGTRALTNLAHFPPSRSASGQAFDGAVIITGLLYQGDRFSKNLRDAVEYLAMKANRGENAESLELVYLDLISLGKRLDWVSLVELMKKVDDINTLRQLAEAARGHEEQFAAVFAAVQLSDQPGQAVKYLDRFPATGVNDLSYAAKAGTGGIEMLLKQQQRIYYPGKFHTKIVSYDPFGAWYEALLPMAQSNERMAILLKYGLLAIASLLLARAVGFAAGQTQWHGLRLGADSLMALSIAFILGLCTEPFVGLPSQIHHLPKLHLPTATLAPGSVLYQLTRPLMPNTTQLSLLPLITFFVIQALIYIWCLTKLNEVRRQPLGAKMKLRLLENEDHLFDAGLYVGLLGTVIALILFFLGIPKFSVMSAYSSTSFGIIFVVILKIFHIRPLRRKLILESEAVS